MDANDIKARIALLAELLTCCRRLYLCHFNGSGEIDDCPCGQENLDRHLILALRPRDNMDKIRADVPHVILNEDGIGWIIEADCQREQPAGRYVIGPFVIQEPSAARVTAWFKRLDMDDPARRAADLLSWLPIISLGHVFEYAIMLHFCLTGERIGEGDLEYRGWEAGPVADNNRKSDVIHGTYQAEREMLRCVREGDLNYRDRMDKMVFVGNQGKLSNGSSLRQVKNMVLVCTTLFSRAAIEGGLSPELSMTLTDCYFQSVEAARSIAELFEISNAMQDDFVRRVHNRRSACGPMAPIQDCVEFIECHLEDELTVGELAQIAGYAEGYFAKLFKREMGLSPREFILARRIGRACELLETTRLPVREIAARLRFCSPSYFSEQFRLCMGISPRAWRERVVEKGRTSRNASCERNLA